MEKRNVRVFNPEDCSFSDKQLRLEQGQWLGLYDTEEPGGEYYLAPGFIDSHAHVYPGATDLGIAADRIGLATGVHLIIDAGSAGSTTYPCFRDYVIPTFQTAVKAFLNISRIGLVTKQPYFDLRNLDVAAAADCIRQDGKERLLGIKVLSSGLVVEAQGLKPLYAALEAAERAGCPLMVHLAEGPPVNEETIRLLRKGDIITHCFHGAPNITANAAAAKGAALNPAYCSADNVMWEPDGTPKRVLYEALERGVLLDVGHGAASFDQTVAAPVIRAGMKAFGISTDAHIRNADTIIHNLPFTMSKFLALGMRLEDVIASVTVIPERQLGLDGWCRDLRNHSTLFRITAVKAGDPPMLDANRTVIQADQKIEVAAVFCDGNYIDVSQPH